MKSFVDVNANSLRLLSLANEGLYDCSVRDSPSQPCTSRKLSSGYSLSLSRSESPSREQVLRSTLLKRTRRVSFAPVSSSHSSEMDTPPTLHQSVKGHTYRDPHRDIRDDAKTFPQLPFPTNQQIDEALLLKCKELLAWFNGTK